MNLKTACKTLRSFRAAETTNMDDHESDQGDIGRAEDIELDNTNAGGTHPGHTVVITVEEASDNSGPYVSTILSQNENENEDGEVGEENDDDELRSNNSGSGELQHQPAAIDAVAVPEDVPAHAQISSTEAEGTASDDITSTISSTTIETDEDSQNIAGNVPQPWILIPWGGPRRARYATPKTTREPGDTDSQTELLEKKNSGCSPWYCVIMTCVTLLFPAVLLAIMLPIIMGGRTPIDELKGRPPLLAIAGDSPVETMAATGPHRWYTFKDSAGGTFGVLLHTTRYAILNVALGSDGSYGYMGSPIDRSGIYIWTSDGFKLIQTIETDGAYAAVAFSVGRKTLLVIANAGTGGSRVTYSRVYRVNPGSEKLTLLQNIPTLAATDLTLFKYNGNDYVTFCSNVTRAGSRATYRWDFRLDRFAHAPEMDLPVARCRAVDALTTGGELYVACGGTSNGALPYQEMSTVFWYNETSSQFVIHQILYTYATTDVGFFKMGSGVYLLIGNAAQDSLGQRNAHLYELDRGRFRQHQLIRAMGVERMHVTPVSLDKVYLTIATSGGDSAIYGWNSMETKFDTVWKGDPSQDLKLFTATSVADDEKLFLIMVHKDPAKTDIFTLE